MAVSCASRIIEREGIAALSVRKIAMDMGYTAGSLYLLFDNLDDLIVHVNARTLDELHDSLAATAARCAEPRECIMALAHAYADFAAQERTRWEAVFQFSLASGRELPSWFQEKIAGMFTLVEAHMERLAPANDAAVAARALWSGVHGVCLLASGGKLGAVGAPSAGVLIETLVGHFLAGYREKGGS